ncbi:MAG TPA: hypothetical protein VGS22_15390 [Thermoanaerobaculia bacterium]|jgi:hypothetical protein|nr:hypothetical protein [Thermoanaerobaculia bacterium]
MSDETIEAHDASLAGGDSRTASGEEPENEHKLNGERHETWISGEKVVSASHISEVHIHQAQSQSQVDTFEDPTFELPPDRPQDVLQFRDPDHSALLVTLETKRVLVLSSFREQAALAAAYSLVAEDRFAKFRKRGLDPTRSSLSERSDLNVDLLMRSEMSNQSEILVVQVHSKCEFLDSVVRARSLHAGSIAKSLRNRSSLLIIATDENLVQACRRPPLEQQTFAFQSVSYLAYLLTSYSPTERREEIEQLFSSERVLRAFREREDIYEFVEDLLQQEPKEFEMFIRDLESAPVGELPGKWRERLRPSGVVEVIVAGSEAQRVAAYSGAFVPSLSPSDFNRLATLFLAKESRLVERERRVVAADGTVHAVREATEESWANDWRRDSDHILRDCHLRPTLSMEGTWSIEFREPYLKRELRIYFERNCVMFLQRRAECLQESGILFARDLTPNLLQGIVSVLVDRAAADLFCFGNSWLLDLVLGFQSQVQVEVGSGTPAERLGEFLAKLAIEDIKVRSHFFLRLAMLIREMLDREQLRPMVHSLLDTLVALRREEGSRPLVLDLIFELARRLRFAPHFEVYSWVRKLLDQGTGAERQSIASRVIAQALGSGPRIFDFLDIVRAWLPEQGREMTRLSNAQRLALEFPFALSLRIARDLPAERYGEWPSRHLIFAPFAIDEASSREKIGMLVGWLLEPSGRAIFPPDPKDSSAISEILRLRVLADLIEHWGRVLEGDDPLRICSEGRSLFQVVVEEVSTCTDPHERAWLQRIWKEKQDSYTRKIGELGRERRDERCRLVERRVWLGDLRDRFAALVGMGAVGAV